MSLHHKEVGLHCAYLSSSLSVEDADKNIICPFRPWYKMKNAEGRLEKHLPDHHDKTSWCICNGTEQLRAVMAIYQSDLYRGRRPSDYLKRPSSCENQWEGCHAPAV